MTFSGCINIDPRTPTEMAAQSIDQAIASIDSNSDQWRNEVDKLGTKLETIESNAAQDVKDIAAKALLLEDRRLNAPLISYEPVQNKISSGLRIN